MDNNFIIRTLEVLKLFSLSQLGKHSPSVATPPSTCGTEPKLFSVVRQQDVCFFFAIFL